MDNLEFTFIVFVCPTPTHDRFPGISATRLHKATTPIVPLQIHISKGVCSYDLRLILVVSKGEGDRVDAMAFISYNGVKGVSM